MVVLSCPFVNHPHSISPCVNSMAQHPTTLRPRLLANSSWRLSCRLNARGAVYANATGSGVPSAAFVDISHPSESSPELIRLKQPSSYSQLDSPSPGNLLPTEQQPKPAKARGRPKKQQPTLISTNQSQADASHRAVPSFSVPDRPASSLSCVSEESSLPEPAHPSQSSSSEQVQPEQYASISQTDVTALNSTPGKQQTPQAQPTKHPFPIKGDSQAWRTSNTRNKSSSTSSRSHQDIFSQLLGETKTELNTKAESLDQKTPQQQQSLVSDANTSSASSVKRVAKLRISPSPSSTTIFGISTGSGLMSGSRTQRSSSRTSQPTTPGQESWDNQDEDETSASRSSSADLRPSFASSILSTYKSSDSSPSSQDPIRKATTPQGLRTADGRARILIGQTSTAGNSAACLARVLREERCAVVQCTGHQPALMALKTITIATSFLNQHNSSITFVPYCDSIWDLTGVSFGVLPNYTLHVFERQILPSETSLLMLMRSAQHVFEFSMHVSRTWQDKCAVVLDQAHHFADVLYTTLLHDHNEHQILLAERSTRLQQQLQKQLQLQMLQQNQVGEQPAERSGSTAHQDQQQRLRKHRGKQQWRESLNRDSQVGRTPPGIFRVGPEFPPDDEIPDPQPIVVSVDLSLALTALASVSLAQRRLMLENAPFSLQVSIYRNTTAPRLDGRNGFVLVVRHSTVGLQSTLPRDSLPAQAPARGTMGQRQYQASSRDRRAQDDEETPYFSQERNGPSSPNQDDDEQWANDGESMRADSQVASVQPIASTRWACVSNDMLEHQLQNKEYIRLPRRHYKPRQGRP